jgi:DNA-binding PadR family transcriptional regulator
MPRRSLGLSLGDHAIIGVLRERPMHGYEIARRFVADLDLGLVLPMDMSTVYALLKDLHEEGLLEGQREVVGLRPPRTVYQLTADAEAQFLRWLEEPVSRLREVRADLLVKLYFCRAISKHATLHLLEAQLVESQTYLARAQQLAAEAAIDSFERLVRASKVSAASATLAWLEAERLSLVA